MIISPINNHANRTYSHRSAWGRMWGACLNVPMGFNADWSKESKVYLEHGMEWKVGAKSINYFLASEKQLAALKTENTGRVLEGQPIKESAWEKLAKKAKMFEDFEGELYSLDVDCPMYGTLLKTRVKPWVPDVFKNINFDKIDEVCKTAKTLRQQDLKRDFVTLGDSHSLSAWHEKSSLCRNDGQTLNGAITRGLDTWLQPFAEGGSSLNKVRIYFGNIDIRHHVCRLHPDNTADQIGTTKDLVLRYFKELQRIGDKYQIDEIEVVAALPIENESRKLPKTGYYKKQPFWGTWKERTAVVNEFNRLCEGLCARLVGMTFVAWPKHFTNESDELDFQYMERPQSVHVSPEHYKWSI